MRASVTNQRLDFDISSPLAIKAMVGLAQHIGKLSLGTSLVALARLRASQTNGCAHCMDVHTADARKGDENHRRLATISAWQLVVALKGWSRFSIACRKMSA